MPNRNPPPQTQREPPSPAPLDVNPLQHIRQQFINLTNQARTLGFPISNEALIIFDEEIDRLTGRRSRNTITGSDSTRTQEVDTHFAVVVQQTREFDESRLHGGDPALSGVAVPRERDISVMDVDDLENDLDEGEDEDTWGVMGYPEHEELMLTDVERITLNRSNEEAKFIMLREDTRKYDRLRELHLGSAYGYRGLDMA